MSRVVIAVGVAQIHATDHVSSTSTGSNHYLRAPNDGVNWRVRGTVVHYELHGRGPVRNCEKVCRCRRCEKLKLRKGGKNINHVFVCADCRSGGGR